MVADRPFLRTIVHPQAGALLIMGRLVDPPLTAPSTVVTVPRSPTWHFRSLVARYGGSCPYALFHWLTEVEEVLSRRT